MSKQTEQLRQNIQSQIDRLVKQLEDLEEEKGDLSKDEYEEMRNETLTEMDVFQKQMVKMLSGDMSLITEFQSAQMAMQAAISKAFQTPEVIRMFANKNNGQLRSRLDQLQRDVQLGKLTAADSNQQKVEILLALQKLGEQLSPAEESFLSEHKSADMKAFESATPDLGTASTNSILNTAANSVKSAKG